MRYAGSAVAAASRLLRDYGLDPLLCNAQQALEVLSDRPNRVGEWARGLDENGLAVFGHVWGAWQANKVMR